MCVCVRCLRLRVRGRYLPLPALSFAICSTAYHAHLVWAQINLHINFFVSPRPRTVGCCLRSGPGLVSWLWRLSSFIIPGQVNCQSDRRFAWSIEVYDKFSHFLEQTLPSLLPALLLATAVPHLSTVLSTWTLPVRDFGEYLMTRDSSIFYQYIST